MSGGSSSELPYLANYAAPTFLGPVVYDNSNDNFTSASTFGHNVTAAGDAGDETYSRGNLFMMILKGITMGILMFMALFGNALVIASVIRIRRLRTVTNYFVVSLAVADFLVAGLVMPFNAIQEILDRWIFPEWVCYFFNSNDVLFCTASVLNLCMVAVDRYVAIVKPLRYRQIMKKRSAALMIASAWVAGLAISYVPIHLNWHLPNFEPNPNAEVCDFKPSALYSLVSSAVSFWIPTLVILFVYGRIYHIAIKQEKEMRRMDQHMANVYGGVKQEASVVIPHSNSAGDGLISKKGSIASSTIANSASHHVLHNGNNKSDYDSSLKRKHLSTLSESSPTRSFSAANAGQFLPHSSGSGASTMNMTNQSRTKAANRSSESRATKVLAIVIGCYLLCWMPFFLWLNVTAICSSCPDTGVLGSFLFWIGYANSTFNPVIYAFFSREFRNAFIASLRIDKWSSIRSLCLKLAKNRTKQPSQSQNVPFPSSRSLPRIVTSKEPSTPMSLERLPDTKRCSESDSIGEPPASTPTSPIPVLNNDGDVIVMHNYEVAASSPRRLPDPWKVDEVDQKFKKLDGVIERSPLLGSLKAADSPAKPAQYRQDRSNSIPTRHNFFAKAFKVKCAQSVDVDDAAATPYNNNSNNSSHYDNEEIIGSNNKLATSMIREVSALLDQIDHGNECYDSADANQPCAPGEAIKS